MTPKDEMDSMLADRRYDDIVTMGSANGAVGGIHYTYASGVAYLMLGRLPEAVSRLREAGADPAYAYWGHHWLGRAHEGLGETAEAFDAWDTARAVPGAPDDARTLLATGLRFLGEPDASPAERERIARRLADITDELISAKAASQAAPDDRAFPILGDLVLRLTGLEERLRDADLARSATHSWPRPFELETDHPVAIDSNDHIHPWGTVNDNTRSPRFVAACARRFGRAIHALDLGCAGGGLVRDFLLAGHRALGLEGSDASLAAQRAEWRTIPDHLKTCDIAKPFRILDVDGAAARFDVITAWEVLEHIPEQALPILLGNIRAHLAPDGLFIASVALTEDFDPLTGAAWHVTLQPRAWWAERFAEAGLEALPSPFAVADHVRGSGNGPMDWDVRLNPEKGFHIAGRLLA